MRNNMKESDYIEYLTRTKIEHSDYIEKQKSLNPSFDDARFLYSHIESVHDWLDENNVPVINEDGDRLSIVGRIMKFTHQL